MNDWWQGLNAREQKMVGGCTLVLVLALFWFALWQPLNESVNRSQVKAQQQEQLLRWVHENVAKYEELKRQGGNRGSSGSLSAVVNRTAKRYQIDIARMQPQGDDLQVWIDQVAFNDLIHFLEQIQQREGLVIQAIDIVSGDEQGTVKVRRLQVGRG
ncbi:type II secretion system protein GspM [Thalassotalea mangrovi]|uniref:Type II secretion system protein M n=1 Tax=Thalassotalea mangrovi TaxID=2572245 RepID=A0A4U1B7U3_9GAMM|nr:type II secretion system protein M [Thalassotalea mangrovi]TKB46684.1 type II secretion system protein M [Thalassotalea mangrovi]